MNYREARNLSRELNKEVDSIDIEIEIEEEHPGRDDYKIGINWAACGTTSLDETEAFAKRLLKAVEIARKSGIEQVK